MAEFRFCPQCATPLSWLTQMEDGGEVMRLRCTACDFTHWNNPTPVLAGIVPQAEGPRYLAACDILASPHVPNPDGTPFFGSPTKLFEYMAMGKGIVASDLDQVGEILEHGRAAQMTVPGSVDSLVEGLRLLIDDPARREALGAEARRVAVERHSWREHTRRIIQALTDRVPVS